MPVYLVRWANLSAALVSARDETHLLDVLDEVGDPTGAKWQVYRGPLHIEFELPVELEVTSKDGYARSLADLKIATCPEELSLDALESGIANSDTGAEMTDAVWKFAFPNLYRALQHNDWALPQEAAKAASLKDLDVLVKAHWQMGHLEKNTDPDAAIASMAGTSLRQVRNVLKRSTTAKPGVVKALKPPGKGRKGK